MCLAVPGKIVKVLAGEGPLLQGEVDFQGSRLHVNLALVPGAAAGDWVLVHAGMAISRLEEKDALETWEYLDAAGLLGKQRAEEER